MADFIDAANSYNAAITGLGENIGKTRASKAQAQQDAINRQKTADIIKGSEFGGSTEGQLFQQDVLSGNAKGKDLRDFIPADSWQQLNVIGKAAMGGDKTAQALYPKLKANLLDDELQKKMMAARASIYLHNATVGDPSTKMVDTNLPGSFVIPAIKTKLQKLGEKYNMGSKIADLFDSENTNGNFLNAAMQDANIAQIPMPEIRQAIRNGVDVGVQTHFPNMVNNANYLGQLITDAEVGGSSALNYSFKTMPDGSKISSQKTYKTKVPAKWVVDGTIWQGAERTYTEKTVKPEPTAKKPKKSLFGKAPAEASQPVNSSQETMSPEDQWMQLQK